MRALLLAVLLSDALLPGRAHAQVIDGDNPVQVSLLTAGTVAGLTNAVAAVVYSAQNRSFDTGWVISTFVSTAACGAFSVGLALEANETGDEFLLLPALFYLSLAAWPGAWAIRGALDEAAPGERLDREHRERERRAVRDPFAQTRAPALPAMVWALPPVRF